MNRISSGNTAHRSAMQIEAEIDHVYDEIRECMLRSKGTLNLQTEIERKREELHALKTEETAILRRRAESMRRLKPGEGDRLLRHAEELLSVRILPLKGSA